MAVAAARISVAAEVLPSDDVDRAGSQAWVASFGAFRLSAVERLLEKDGVPVHLGGRALDLLIALVDAASQVVSKRDLIARVWPRAVVEESSLRVHMVAVRKALGDGIAGARYIANVAGRGYCFVAPVSRAPSLASAIASARIDRVHGLPEPLPRMVGRHADLQEMKSDLLSKRFLTIVGPGGIGKTTVAVALARSMLPTFDGAVRFVDLAAVSQAVLVPGTVAGALGLAVHFGDATSSIVNFLRDKRMLLVLDNCEHVIDAVAPLAERVHKEAPEVHLLATSRESLRVEGEYLCRLLPLACPADDETLDAEQALAYPAVQLFAQRAAAGASRYRLSDADAPTVASICRKLDGIALAIELAAGGIDAYGIHGVAALLGRQLKLRWHGRRTAVPRHQTMSAALQWSYNLLPDLECAILRRLSIFVGKFSLESAQAVAAQDDVDEGAVVEAIVSLVAKSLLIVAASGEARRYRLLGITRVYVLDKLIECGEFDAVASRHACYCRAVLERSRMSGPDVALALTLHEDMLGNVRQALGWSLSDRGNGETGTALAAALAPLLLEKSLLCECRRWMKRALVSLDDSLLGTRREMELQAALGESSMFSGGNSEETRKAFSRGLECAVALEEPAFQLRLLGGLGTFLLRSGSFRDAFEVAARADALARQMDDPTAMAMVNSMLGASLDWAGDVANAAKHWKAALADAGESQRIHRVRLGLDHRIHALCGQARNHWLSGCCDHAAAVAAYAVEQAELLEHPVTRCIALIWAGSVFFWRGDLSRSEEIVDRLSAHATKHTLATYQAVATGLRGELSIKQGRTERGISLVRESLQALQAHRYELRTATLITALAAALNEAERHAEAMTAIEQAIAFIERCGDGLHRPEALRVKAEILASTAGTDPHLAQRCFHDAIDCARRQPALSWELRSASGLARLWLKQGRTGAARQLLAPIYDAFVEGRDTVDHVAARQLLDELGRVTH